MSILETIGKEVVEAGKKNESFMPKMEDANWEIKDTSEGNDWKEAEIIEEVYPNIEVIESNSIQQIFEENRDKTSEIREALMREEENLNTSEEGVERDNEGGEKKGLTDEEKAKIKEATGWSDEIIDSIGSMEEAEIYMKANLKEGIVNGKKCLIRSDIDWNQKDEMGRTNKERAEQGLSPINKDGKTIELHHIGQKADSPLAELTPEEHRSRGNDTILHDKTKESEIDRQAFAGERSDHWEARAEKGGNV